MTSYNLILLTGFVYNDDLILQKYAGRATLCVLAVSLIFNMVVMSVLSLFSCKLWLKKRANIAEHKSKMKKAQKEKEIKAARKAVVLSISLSIDKLVNEDVSNESAPDRSYIEAKFKKADSNKIDPNDRIPLKVSLKPRMYNTNFAKEESKTLPIRSNLGNKVSMMSNISDAIGN